MADRVYISTISAAWTVQRQRELLADVLPKAGAAVYEEAISQTARKLHRGADLKERADMLKPTSRRTPETIHVASLSVLAWDAADLVSALAAAAARNATVRAHDVGLDIAPDAATERVHEAVQAFTRTRRDAQTSIGRAGGWKVAAANREAATAAKIALIKDDWPLRTFRTPELLARAGTTYPTVVAVLGKRPAAQAAHDKKLARQARKDAKK